MSRGWQVLLLGVLFGSVGTAVAGEYRVYAPVVNVEPIYEIRYETVTRMVCSAPDASQRAFPEVAATLGEDIRRQQLRWQQLHSCRSVTEHLPRKRLTAYRVTYRYRGHTATTRLDHDPGERIPLQVNLSPLR